MELHWARRFPTVERTAGFGKVSARNCERCRAAVQLEKTVENEGGERLTRRVDNLGMLLQGQVE